MGDLEKSIEMGCSVLINALLSLEKLNGEHDHVEFTCGFKKVDYRITVARMNPDKSNGRKNR